MAVRAAPTAIGRSGVRGYRAHRRERQALRCAPAATDRFAPKRFANRPAARQRGSARRQMEELAAAKFHDALSIKIVCDAHAVAGIRTAAAAPLPPSISSAIEFHLGL